MIAAKSNLLQHPLLFLLMVAFSGCQLPFIVENNIVTYPPYPVKTRPERIVIVNGYNLDQASLRSHKQEQFTALIQETMKTLEGTLRQKFATSVVIIPGGFKPLVYTDTIQNFLEKNAATHSVTITHFDAFFDQTEVHVTETESGKEREAFYDIVVSVGYSWNIPDNQRLDTVISVRKYHSSRSVLSGFLAGGPNIVKNDAEARAGLVANVNAYMRCFFQDSTSRSRVFYGMKDFRDASNAFQMMDYSKIMLALEESLNSSDPKIAARGNYNLAVLLERLGDYDEIKPYLLEALRLQPNLPGAKEMLQDYRYR